MKTLIMIIFVLVPISINAQIERDIIYNALDSTAIIPIEKLRVVDMWARRGVECRTYIAKMDSLTTIIAGQSKLHDETVAGIRQNLDLMREENLRIIADANTAKVEMSKYYALSQSLQKTIDECRRRETLSMWGNIGMGAVILGVCGAVIATSGRR